MDILDIFGIMIFFNAKNVQNMTCVCSRNFILVRLKKPLKQDLRHVMPYDYNNKIRGLH